MSRRRRRWMIGAPIVGFWLLMMGLLLRGELGVRRSGAVGAERLSEPTDSWLGVYLAEGQRVGHVHLRQIPEERHQLAGVRMELAARMSLELIGKSTDLDLSGSIWRPYESPRAEFDFAVRSAGFDFELSGEVADGELRSEMVSAGEVIPWRLPVNDAMIFSGGLGSALRFPALEVGEQVRLDTFDPLTLSKSEARVRCVAREVLSLSAGEVETCRLSVQMSGLKSLAWIDDTGEVVRAETPIGLVLERISPHDATAPVSGQQATAGLLSRTAIRPSGQRPFRAARAMTIQLRGLDDLRLPEDRVQVSLGGGRYRLSVPAEPPPGLDPASSPAVAPFLGTDAFIQSDHPKIESQAAAVVGDETDPWLRSRAIHDWVFSRLDKEPVLSIPSALEVLEQRRGDCNEHTVLFTALARAAGVPTRVAIGLVWSDELEGFYYHAWPEVHLGDWVWMDPTLDQPLADATHVKLLTGGIEQWPRLLPYLGKLEIEVLEIE
ncbi:MAG: transglutaminase domain-containing protein [bacterium]|nr:transglutaminase domain-containing protein [bacterium]